MYKSLINIMREYVHNEYNRRISSQYKILNKIKWKNLIILDACRFDYFAEQWKGEVLKVYSPASTTQKWLERTFPHKYNLKVVSANPFIGHKKNRKWRYNANEHFKEVISAWMDYWTEKYGCVLPKTMYDLCIKTKDESTWIFWFLQPHSPYIDLELGVSVESFTNWDGEKDFKNYYPIEIKKLYKKNLEYVLPFVKKLSDACEKPTIITSDHGELLGEYGVIGHPNIKCDELRHVPMVIIE